ncbi:MAG: peptidoglycan DD-metalloendopeptidase family protein [Gammaproteobacteria bacterium]|nr:peptidoglycan DD-metalloendopeptidase family protein [Gammaproteobacteria bacterium]
MVFLIATSSLPGCGSHFYHQVRDGDTLYSISWSYDRDYHDVARWNDIEPPYTVHYGDWLRVVPPVDGEEGAVQPKKHSPGKAPVRSSQPTTVAKTPAHPDSRQAIAPVDAAPIVRDEVEWQWPAQGDVVHRYDARSQGKKGIAISGMSGDAVKAAASGKVVYSGDGLRGYGKLLIIKHNDKYLSAYAHNRELLVKEGEQVSRGQGIARMGSTEADRVKLHFEIRADGKPVDPLRYLPKGGS